MTQDEVVVSHNVLSLLLRTWPDAWRPGPRSGTHPGREALGGGDGLLVGRALEDAAADVTYAQQRFLASFSFRCYLFSWEWSLLWERLR